MFSNMFDVEGATLLLCPRSKPNVLTRPPSTNLFILPLRAQSTHQNIQSRALKRSISRTHKTPIPVQSELIISVPIRLPDTVRVAIEEVGISGFRTRLLQYLQVTSEDALELRTITAAIRFARVVKDAITIGQFLDHSVGDFLGCCGVAGIFRCFRQLR